MKLKLSAGEFGEKLQTALKQPKGLLIAGLAGILLIFLSTVLPSGKGREAGETFSAEAYRKQLETSVTQLVQKITGDRKCTVVITLESGARYVYADSTATSSADSSTESGAMQTNSSTTRSYITVRNESGGEQALPVTVYMPQIRGVAIVCAGGEDPALAEWVRNAVTAALHITTSRVYITGGNGR